MSQADSPADWISASNRPLPTYARASADEPIERDTRTALQIARTRVAAARPPSASATTKSDSCALSEARMGRSPRHAGPSSVAEKCSSRVGSWTTPTAGRPSTTRAIETQKNGMPFA